MLPSFFFVSIIFKRPEPLKAKDPVITAINILNNKTAVLNFAVTCLYSNSCWI